MPRPPLRILTVCPAILDSIAIRFLGIEFRVARLSVRSREIQDESVEEGTAWVGTGWVGMNADVAGGPAVNKRRQGGLPPAPPAD